MPDDALAPITVRQHSITLHLAQLYRRNGPGGVEFAENLADDPLQRGRGLVWTMSFTDWLDRGRPITITATVVGE